MIREFIAEFQREVQEQRLAALAAKSGAEQGLAKVTKEIDNIITAIAQGMFHASMKARMDTLEADKARLIAQLADLPEPEPVTLHPGLADTYARTIAGLATTLNADNTREEAADILRRPAFAAIDFKRPSAAPRTAIPLIFLVSWVRSCRFARTVALEGKKPAVVWRAFGK